MSTLANKTRTSSSIPSRLIREGRAYLLPLYYVLRLSDLSREGIEGSGSFRFADHIYKFEANGLYGVGTVLDWFVLRLPSSRSFRNRYLNARKEVLKAIRELAPHRSEIHVLSIPSGLPRELADAAVTLREKDPQVFAKVHFHGMDLDHEPLELSKPFVADRGLAEKFSWHHGNALQLGDFPRNIDVVTSTGLADFLTDAQLVTFYKNVHEILNPGGVFISSGMKPHGLSDWLMRNLAELHTQYRDMDGLEAVVNQTDFSRYKLYTDEFDIQTMIVARKADSK